MAWTRTLDEHVLTFIRLQTNRKSCVLLVMKLWYPICFLEKMPKNCGRILEVTLFSFGRKVVISCLEFPDLGVRKSFPLCSHQKTEVLKTRKVIWHTKKEHTKTRNTRSLFHETCIVMSERQARQKPLSFLTQSTRREDQHWEQQEEIEETHFDLFNSWDNSRTSCTLRVFLVLFRVLRTTFHHESHAYDSPRRFFVFLEYSLLLTFHWEESFFQF